MSKIEEALKRKPFFVVGHRGAKGAKPENTISAIEYAISIGVDIIEVDVRRTKDKKLILLHDQDFKRVAGLDRKASELDYSYIKENIRIDGEPVATLDECLETIKGKTGLFIEIKEPETTDDILATVIKHNAVEWVAVISFYENALKMVKELLPSIKTGLIYMKPPGKISEAKEIKAEIVLPFYKIATAKANYFAHKLGLKVVVWTVNDEKTAKEMVERKADGIATDYPELILSFREKLAEPA